MRISSICKPFRHVVLQGGRQEVVGHHYHPKSLSRIGLGFRVLGFECNGLDYLNRARAKFE